MAGITWGRRSRRREEEEEEGGGRRDGGDGVSPEMKGEFAARADGGWVRQSNSRIPMCLIGILSVGLFYAPAARWSLSEGLLAGGARANDGR